MQRGPAQRSNSVSAHHILDMVWMVEESFLYVLSYYKKSRGKACQDKMSAIKVLQW